MDVLLLLPPQVCLGALRRAAEHGSLRGLHDAWDLQHRDKASSVTPAPRMFCGFFTKSLINSKFQGKRKLPIPFFDQVSVTDHQRDKFRLRMVVPFYHLELSTGTPEWSFK